MYINKFSVWAMISICSAWMTFQCKFFQHICFQYVGLQYIGRLHPNREIVQSMMHLSKRIECEGTGSTCSWQLVENMPFLEGANVSTGRYIFKILKEHYIKPLLFSKNQFSNGIVIWQSKMISTWALKWIDKSWVKMLKKTQRCWRKLMYNFQCVRNYCTWEKIW